MYFDVTQYIVSWVFVSQQLKHHSVFWNVVCVTGRSGISSLQRWSVAFRISGNSVPDVPGCTPVPRGFCCRESSPSFHMPQPRLPQAAEELHTLSFYQSTRTTEVRPLLCGEAATQPAIVFPKKAWGTTAIV